MVLWAEVLFDGERDSWLAFVFPVDGLLGGADGGELDATRSDMLAATMVV